MDSQEPYVKIIIVIWVVMRYIMKDTIVESDIDVILRIADTQCRMTVTGIQFVPWRTGDKRDERSVTHFLRLYPTAQCKAQTESICAKFMPHAMRYNRGETNNLYRAASPHTPARAYARSGTRACTLILRRGADQY